MLKKAISVSLCIIMILATVQLAPFDTSTAAAPAVAPVSRIDLTEWKIACSGTVSTSSLPTATNQTNTIQKGYDTSSWVPAHVPSSIEGALVDAGRYGSNVGMKLDPDGKYDVYYDDNFAKVPVGDFANPWWYSTDFNLTSEQMSNKVTLTFKGISYTGNVFVNGTEITNKNISILSDNELRNRSGSAPNWTYADVTGTITAANSSVGGTGFAAGDFDLYKNLFKGAFRTYELDITDLVSAGSNNIKVLVRRPVYKSDSSDNATSGDFASFWVDWHPTPADMNGGMIGNAFITLSSNVRLSNPAAASVVASNLNSATVKFYVDVNNLSNAAISGTLKASVYGPDGALVVNLPDTAVTVAANAYCQEVALAPWAVSNPQLWWPYMSGDQPLYTVSYTFVTGGQADEAGKLDHRFGIRQIEQRVTQSSTSSSSNQPQLQIYVNHLPIMCKGGGYCPTDLLLRQSTFNDQACIDLVKSMGFNMIRDEGKFFSENLLDLMDENGILYMVGWCCCDRHQNPNAFTKAERFVTYESLYSQIRTIRAHACAGVWLNGSDAPPDGSNANGQNIGRKYLEIEGRLRWFEIGAIACSAEATASNLSGGRSGLHMDSSYDAQSASLCYTSASQGSLGFISEGHGGPGVPYVESLKRFIPAANLWPYNAGANYNVWNYHSARASFANIDQQQVFVDCVYGASNTIEVANARSQLFQYEIQRASYEALNFYRFNQSSGLINWMLNDARPGIMWNQFDYYMNPFGSTFGAGKANEPVHIMYNPAMMAAYNPAGQAVRPTPRSISIVNSTPEAFNGMTATATIYDMNGKIISNPLVKTVDVKPDGIVAYTGTATNRTVGYTPNGAWITGGFSNFTVPYAQTATGSTGLTVLWTNDDINNSLTKPTGDVYFLRLELADSTGKVVSYNNYAIPRRESVNGTSSSWARGTEAQTQDLTLLNSLPAIDMSTGLVMTQTGSVKAGDRITQTLSITNNTGIVAYGVDIKAYMDDTRKTLVAPSLYSDNLMIIFPGQTREITVTHYASVLDKDSIFTISCYNNVIQNKPVRSGNVYDPVFNRDTATPTATSATTNLAKGKTQTGLNNANAITIASVALSNAAFTVIDSNISTASTLATTSTTGFSLDLGSAPVKYDKVMLRWSAAAATGGNTNMLAGVPTTIRVDTSADNSTWNTVLTFDNTNARSAMTEIIFPATQTARYIRFVPNGTVGNAAAYGAVTGAPGGGFRHSVSARNAAASWNVCSVEIYPFRTSVFLDIVGNGSITAGSVAYTKAMTANHRSITPDINGNITLKFTSNTPAYPIAIFKDGVNITGQLDTNNEIAFTGISADTEILAVYDGSAAAKINLTEWKLACSGNVATSSLPTATNLNNTIQPGFDTSAWIPAAVPGSLEGALVDAKVYGANVGMKLDPDGNYDVYYDDNFAKVPIGDFANPWWYSNDFTLSSIQAANKVTLTFKGISYTGRVFVNGNELTNKNIDILSDNELRNRSGSAPNWVYSDVTTTITAANSSVGGTGFAAGDYDLYKNLFKGAFRTYELDITEFVKPGINNIKVLVTRPVYKQDSSDNATSGDFASFWVDWHPTPADMNGGMIGNAFITLSSDVRLSNPAAASVVANDLSSATVKFYVDVNNMTNAPVSGTLKARVYSPDGALAASLPDTPVTVAANAYCQEVALTPWVVTNPQLWWPYLSGDQPLYTIEYKFETGGIADEAGKLTHRFGIRQIEQRVTQSSTSSSSNQPQLQIYVNHLPIMCKGGGYCPTDLLLRQSAFNDRACIDLVKSMGFNMIRDEGKFFSENLLDLMDENGILYMVGWCCCDRHQNPNAFTKAERFVTYQSVYSQIRTIRAHACAGVWLNGSDAPPDGSNANGQNIGRKYLEIEGRLRWFEIGAIACSAEATASNLSGGRSGLHMDSSYDAQSASLCYTSASQGSLGFISEGHGGPGVPYVESLKRFIPAANLWPYNSGANYNVWNYHSARASFANIDQQQVFVDCTYGASDTIEVANARSQLFQYDIQRASYEALNFYRFNQSSGLINWMLNDARPGIMWNQFDYYMNPFGSTFGAGKANEPVHIMYNPAMMAAYNPAGQAVRPTPRSISIVNSTPEAFNGMTATATIYDMNGRIISNPLVKTVNVQPDGIIAYTGTATNRTVGYTPNGEWITGGFNNVTVPYAQTATGSTGLTVLWTNDDINNSLIKPTGDVYFLRLELADSTGKVVSYNNYAIPRRESVNGTSSSWARGAEAQTQDLTLLNSLPAIDMDTGLVMTQTGSVKTGDSITQRLSITNNTDIIAYGVDIKAYMDATCKTLVAPSLYSDNLMIIFPGQTREITVTHYASVLDKDSVFTINCYNNVIQNKPARSGNVYDTVFNRDIATPTATSATTNLAKGKTQTGLNNANAITIASVALSNAAFTIIDSNISTVSTLATTSTTGFTLDLGAAPVQYDKVMLRWSAAASTGGNTNMLAGVPTTIRVDTSANNSTWNTVLTFDNTNARSAMTEIIFPVMQTARYVRFVPNGTVGNAAAYGAVSGTLPSGFRHSVPARNAAANWNICSIEMYAFKSSAFIEDLGAGSITAAGRSYTMGSNALERLLQSGVDGSINFTFTPSGSGSFKVKFETAYPQFQIEVFRDGLKITPQLNGDNELILSGITEATVIRAVFDGTETLLLEADKTALVPGETVNFSARVPASYPNAGNLFIASYVSGKLDVLQTYDAAQGVLVTTQFTVPANATEVKAFLWEAGTYIPLIEAVSIK